MEENNAYIVYQKDIEEISRLIDMLANTIGCMLEKKEIPTPPWDEQQSACKNDAFSLECEYIVENILEDEIPW